ncbi:transposase [Escherichia coli]|nr:transposase [Escherichia coli]
MADVARRKKRRFSVLFIDWEAQYQCAIEHIQKMREIEHASVLYSLIGTCRLNNVESKKWLCYIIEYIEEWPTNRGRDLLSGKVGLTEK